MENHVNWVSRLREGQAITALARPPMTKTTKPAPRNLSEGLLMSIKHFPSVVRNTFRNTAMRVTTPSRAVTALSAGIHAGTGAVAGMPPEPPRG